MMTQLFAALLAIPTIGWLSCILMSKRWERAIFAAAATAISLEVATLFVFGYQWLSAGADPVSLELGALYASDHYAFSLNFYFDTLGAVFMGTAALMTILVFVFSKFYMHREPGFKRFYHTILLFFIGLTLIILAGNFEVLLIGWEFIGISSVLLIAFYRDRFLPARNALKVFSVYRIADAFLLVSIWYAHHIFERSVNFSEYATVVAEHGDRLALLGVFLLIVALIKSAQFPFSYWLPRAMEGPTTSTAIFYGALSVHMGLFLLLRTYPLWEGSVGVRIAVAAVGLATALVATTIARTQSSIKTQIAYASVTQIGIMFIELAAGLHWLVLVHFVSNAALRTYQLLISPSAVSYLVHDQFFYFVPPAHKIKNTLLGKLRATAYVLGIKEWNMNTFMSHYLWAPFKSAGRLVAFLDKKRFQAVVLALFLAAAGVASFMSLSDSAALAVSTVAGVVALLLYARAFTTKASATLCWNLIMLGHLFGALFLGLASGGSWKHVAMYGAGVVLAFALGHLCLWYVRVRGGESLTLRDYNGVIHPFRKVGHLFFVVCLLFMAFPISPSFLAQDILLSGIATGHAVQIALFVVAYLIMGVSVMRLYIKVFFGSHRSNHHEIAYRSS